MAFVGSSVAAAITLVDYPIAGGQALRYSLAGLVLVSLAKGRLPRLTRSQAGRLLALAATGLAGFNAFLIAAVREADAAGVGVIVGCVPVALALAGPLLERRPLELRVLGAAVVVASGAGAVQWTGGTMSLEGLVLAIGALACEAAFSLLAAPMLASLGPRAVSAYACLFAVPLLLFGGIALDGGGALPLPSIREAAALAYLGGVVTALAFVLWYVSVGRLGVERAGLFAGILPVSALASAAAIGASDVTPLSSLGALAVGVGVAAGVPARSARIGGTRGRLGMTRAGPLPRRTRWSRTSTSAGCTTSMS
jgi:drug/metabolite transporter (DMT)-like permease